VEGVSKTEIQAFLEKINQKYPGKRYRLPTQAEWEHAQKVEKFEEIAPDNHKLPGGFRLVRVL
jgi:formylglycine-generating enzyme required for sulfatase activity